jgi:hypothetical protein
MTDRATLRAQVEAAIKALDAVEWSYSPSAFSPVCYWCRGYERHPAMDQDYYGKAGHKPDCQRQLAIAGLQALLDAETGTGWQPIATAPDDRTWFLAWSADLGFFVYRLGPGLIASEEPDPTHWMPLPAPPGAETGTAPEPVEGKPGVFVSGRGSSSVFLRTAPEQEKPRKVRTKLPKPGELRERAILGGEPSL